MEAQCFQGFENFPASVKKYGCLWFLPGPEQSAAILSWHHDLRRTSLHHHHAPGERTRFGAQRVLQNAGGQVFGSKHYFVVTLHKGAVF